MKYIILIVLIFTSSLSVCLADSKAKILVTRKGSESFAVVLSAIKDELGDEDYDFIDWVIDKDTDFGDFKDKVEDEKPTMLVLMDNKAVKFGMKFNSQAKKKIKGVALMGLNLKRLLKGNKHIAGIAYETPAYTLVTQFRFISKKKVRNALVFYRKSLFGDRIKRAKKLLKSEGIKLIGINVEKDGKKRADVEKWALENVFKITANAKKYDVVWILLDSGILSKNLFAKLWIPAARKSKIPFIAGTEKFVSKKFNFCTFAITPNLPDYGGQAAQMIATIFEDDTPPSELGVEDLIAVNKVINLQRVSELNFKLIKKNMSEIEKIE